MTFRPIVFEDLYLRILQCLEVIDPNGWLLGRTGLSDAGNDVARHG